jgi:hypothetical protein
MRPLDLDAFLRQQLSEQRDRGRVRRRATNANCDPDAER